MQCCRFEIKNKLRTCIEMLKTTPYVLFRQRVLAWSHVNIHDSWCVCIWDFMQFTGPWSKYRMYVVNAQKGEHMRCEGNKQIWNSGSTIMFEIEKTLTLTRYENDMNEKRNRNNKIKKEKKRKIDKENEAKWKTKRELKPHEMRCVHNPQCDKKKRTHAKDHEMTDIHKHEIVVIVRRSVNSNWATLVWESRLKTQQWYMVIAWNIYVGLVCGI